MLVTREELMNWIEGYAQGTVTLDTMEAALDRYVDGVIEEVMEFEKAKQEALTDPKSLKLLEEWSEGTELSEPLELKQGHPFPDGIMPAIPKHFREYGY